VTGVAVSVVVAVHNVDRYLSRCLDSVCEQTHADLEILLVDDGSTDNTGLLCDEYASLDPRITVIHEPHAGVSAARNAGLRRARAPYVAFLDGDDWADPGWIAGLLQRAELAGADVVLTGYHVDFVDAAGKLRRTETRRPEPQSVEPAVATPDFGPQLVNFVGYAWNKLYRRSVLVEGNHEFPEGLDSVEDMVFNADVLAACEHVVVTDDAYVHYVQRPIPTLGNVFRPDQLRLRLMALDGLTSLARSWSLAEVDVCDLRASRGATALRVTLRSTATTRSLSFSAKASQLSETLRDGEVQAFLDELWSHGQLGRTNRLIVRLLRGGHVRTVLAALRLGSSGGLR
jgi:hypothetical protein